MTRLLVIGLCIVCVRFIAAELTCPEGEIVNDCPTPCQTTCPKSEKEAKELCPKPNPCPEPTCQCRYFERRADNGTCINTRQCPPFDCSSRPNERFDPCPALCPTEDCSQASLKGRCPFRIGIVLICNPACRCIKDHYRKDGICVPEAECGNGDYDSTSTTRPQEESTTPSADDTQNVETQTLEISPSGEISVANASATSDSTDKEKTCGPNEEYDCRKSCPPDTCASNTIKCANEPTEVCKGGCYCKGGFLRANKTEPCMPQCNCENIANTDLCKQK